MVHSHIPELSAQVQKVLLSLFKLRHEVLLCIVVHIEGEENSVPKHLKRVFRAVVLLQFSDHCAQIDRDHIPPDEELVLLRDLELCEPAAHSIALFSRPAVVIIDDVLHPDIFPGDFGIFVLNILEKGHTAQGIQGAHGGLTVVNAASAVR